MSLKNSIPFVQKINFVGVNYRDAPDELLDGHAADCINVFSEPVGAIATRSGYAKLNTTTCSATAAITGGWQFRTTSGGTPTNYDIFMCADGDIHQMVSSAVYDLETGLQAGQDILWSCMNAKESDGTLIVVMVPGDGNTKPRKWDGTGGTTAVTSALGGTTITADFCIEWQNYYWLHHMDTNHMYYATTINDAESDYTSFLNYDTPDPADLVKGVGKSGDDMIMLKSWSAHRTQYRGGAGASKFEKFVIPSGIGTVSHHSIQSLPDGRMIWLGPDNNVYMLMGNVVRSIGDKIKPFLEDCDQDRLRYASSGLLRKRGLYLLSVTYGTVATTHNRTIAIDYEHSYQDSHGEIQYPCWIWDTAANAMWQAYVSGDERLYFGGYTGFIYRMDTGTADGEDSTAINSFWQSKHYSFGETTMEKKFRKLFVSYQRKGSVDLAIEFIANGDAGTSKTKTITMTAGAGGDALWDIAEWDVDSWSSETSIDDATDIDIVGKLLQIKFSLNSATSGFRVYNFTPFVQGLGRGTVRSRES